MKIGDNSMISNAECISDAVQALNEHTNAMRV